MLKYCTTVSLIYSLMRYRGSLGYSSCCQPLLTPWLKKKCMFVCVYATHDVRTLYTRSHVHAQAAVKLLLVLVVVVCSVMLGADANITDVTQKRLCCNVLGEDVGRVVDRVDLDNPHEVVCDQLLYEKVFELDVFGFL